MTKPKTLTLEEVIMEWHRKKCDFKVESLASAIRQFYGERLDDLPRYHVNGVYVKYEDVKEML